MVNLAQAWAEAYGAANSNVDVAVAGGGFRNRHSGTNQWNCRHRQLQSSHEKQRINQVCEYAW